MAGTALAKLKQQMAARADDYADEEKVSSAFISTEGGILKYGDEELPGNEMLVVILDSIHENTYYPEAYDRNVKLPPKCFAIGREEKEMEPHPNVPDEDDDNFETSYFEMQDVECATCPHYQWGSADKGAGKACANRRRLAIIPAGRFEAVGKRGRDTEMEVFEEVDDYKSSDVAFMKLPVTSTKNYSKYVQMLRKEHSLPPFGVLTHIYLESDAKTQFKVHFDMVEVIEDEDILKLMIKRNSEAMETIEQPYNEPTDEEMDAPKSKARTGLAGLKKKKQGRR